MPSPARSTGFDQSSVRRRSKPGGAIDSGASRDFSEAAETLWLLLPQPLSATSPAVARHAAIHRPFRCLPPIFPPFPPCSLPSPDRPTLHPALGVAPVCVTKVLQMRNSPL